MDYLLMAAALMLVFGNGANDNFKGFATVWGSATLSYRKALLLATLSTAAGSLLSLTLAGGLAQQFSGKGLLPQVMVGAPAFMTSTGIGAALTILIATRAGLPISTTHALIGGLIGSGLAASPGDVQFGRLWGSFLLPLLLSPVMAAALGLLAYRLLRPRTAARACVCITPARPALVGGGTAPAVLTVPGVPQLVIASAHCDRLERPIARLSVRALLDRLHVGSASLICFARAVNDTPKLAALLLAAQLLGAQLSIVLIAAVMAAGGLLFARRVAETMSQRVARLDHAQGVAANLITAALVLGASQMGMPVSTTHVSVGSIAGAGAGADSLRWDTLRNILLSWIATLPLAAGIAGIMFKLL